MAREPESELPTALRTFLYGSIEAVEQIEILITLRRTGRGMAAGQIAEELLLTQDISRRHLERLAGKGLLDAKLGPEDVVYRYDPQPANLSEPVDLLVRYYASSRTTVVRFVSARRAVYDFASAFHLRDSK